MLGYCRELGVPLEVEVNSSRSALMVNDKAFGGKAIQQREAINDTRGPCVRSCWLSASRRMRSTRSMSAEDKERMLTFLRTYGDLRATATLQGLRSLAGGAALTRRGQRNRGNKAAARHGFLTRCQLLGRHDV